MNSFKFWTIYSLNWLAVLTTFSFPCIAVWIARHGGPYATIAVDILLVLGLVATVWNIRLWYCLGRKYGSNPASAPRPVWSDSRDVFVVVPARRPRLRVVR